MEAKPPVVPRVTAGRGQKEAGAAAEEELIDEVRRLRVLAEVADSVTQHLSLDHQLPRLINLIADAFGADRAALFLCDREAGELFSRVLRGEGVTEIRMPANSG